MKGVFIWSLLSGIGILMFIGLLISKFFINKKGIVRFSLVGLFIFIFCGIMAIYTTVNKAYNKASNINSEEFITESVHKLGEIGGESVTNFADGIGDGHEKALATKASISKNLTDKAVKLGKIKAISNNVLSVYLIFDSDFNDTITTKILDERKIEIGRTSINIDTKKNTTGYYDFKFDEKTVIEEQSTIHIY